MPCWISSGTVHACDFHLVFIVFVFQVAWCIFFFHWSKVVLHNDWSMFIYTYWRCRLHKYAMHNTFLMMTSSNGNIFRVTGLLCGELTDSPHKGQWRRALMFSLIYAWIHGSANNRKASDLRRNRAHYDVIVMWNIMHTVNTLLCFAVDWYRFGRTSDIGHQGPTLLT